MSDIKRIIHTGAGALVGVDFWEFSSSTFLFSIGFVIFSGSGFNSEGFGSGALG
jgi:hypothetical protein